MSAQAAHAAPAMPPAAEPAFRLAGVHHLALTCSDMQRTIAFYRDVLGMPLVKTIDFPNGRGKHYFFDIGHGDMLAFFEFPGGPAVPERRAHEQMAATPGMMHHIAFNVAAADIDRYRERLAAAGVEVTAVVNHDDTPTGVSAEVNATTFCRSIYFRDPDGTMLEFSAWVRDLATDDVRADLRA